MPWIENDREAALFWWNGKVDQPYRWAGNETKDGGYDCSGLMNGALRVLGITDKDLTAADLAQMFPAKPNDSIQPGDLVFWKSKTSDRIVHVEAVWYVQKDGTVLTIGASGGGPWVTTPTAAQKSNAYVKRHKAVGWVFARNPFGD